MVFILIKRAGYNPENPSTEWWNITPSDKNKLDLPIPTRPEIKLFNGGGGYNFLLESDTILELLMAKDWDILEELEHRQKTTYYQRLKENSTNKELKCGWLSPEGEMHYCEYHEHISYVHEVLGSDVPTIEKQGWLHILKGDRGQPPVFVTHEKRITQEQARTLREELGCHVFEEQILYQ